MNISPWSRNDRNLNPKVEEGVKRAARDADEAIELQPVPAKTEPEQPRRSTRKVLAPRRLKYQM